jgi:hypothetical protein
MVQSLLLIVYFCYRISLVWWRLVESCGGGSRGVARRWRAAAECVAGVAGVARSAMDVRMGGLCARGRRHVGRGVAGAWARARHELRPHPVAHRVTRRRAAWGSACRRWVAAECASSAARSAMGSAVGSVMVRCGTGCDGEVRCGVHFGDCALWWLGGCCRFRGVGCEVWPLSRCRLGRFRGAGGALSGARAASYGGLARRKHSHQLWEHDGHCAGAAPITSS